MVLYRDRMPTETIPRYPKATSSGYRRVMFTACIVGTCIW